MKKEWVVARIFIIITIAVYFNFMWIFSQADLQLEILISTLGAIISVLLISGFAELKNRINYKNITSKSLRIIERIVIFCAIILVVTTFLHKNNILNAVDTETVAVLSNSATIGSIVFAYLKIFFSDLLKDNIKISINTVFPKFYNKISLIKLNEKAEVIITNKTKQNKYMRFVGLARLSDFEEIEGQENNWQRYLYNSSLNRYRFNIKAKSSYSALKVDFNEIKTDLLEKGILDPDKISEVLFVFLDEENTVYIARCYVDVSRQKI